MTMVQVEGQLGGTAQLPTLLLEAANIDVDRLVATDAATLAVVQRLSGQAQSGLAGDPAGPVVDQALAGDGDATVGQHAAVAVVQVA
ncbi:hypothetical protein WCE03_04090 [Pseudomonas guariconensis]